MDAIVYNRCPLCLMYELTVPEGVQAVRSGEIVMYHHGMIPSVSEEGVIRRDLLRDGTLCICLIDPKKWNVACLEHRESSSRSDGGCLYKNASDLIANVYKESLPLRNARKEYIALKKYAMGTFNSVMEKLTADGDVLRAEINVRNLEAQKLKAKNAALQKGIRV